MRGAPGTVVGAGVEGLLHSGLDLVWHAGAAGHVTTRMGAAWSGLRLGPYSAPGQELDRQMAFCPQRRAWVLRPAMSDWSDQATVDDAVGQLGDFGFGWSSVRGIRNFYPHGLTNTLGLLAVAVPSGVVLHPRSVLPDRGENILRGLPGFDDHRHTPITYLKTQYQAHDTGHHIVTDTWPGNSNYQTFQFLWNETGGGPPDVDGVQIRQGLLGHGTLMATVSSHVHPVPGRPGWWIGCVRFEPPDALDYHATIPVNPSGDVHTTYCDGVMVADWNEDYPATPQVWANDGAWTGTRYRRSLRIVPGYDNNPSEGGCLACVLWPYMSKANAADDIAFCEIAKWGLGGTADGNCVRLITSSSAKKLIAEIRQNGTAAAYMHGPDTWQAGQPLAVVIAWWNRPGSRQSGLFVNGERTFITLDASPWPLPQAGSGLFVSGESTSLHTFHVPLVGIGNQPIPRQHARALSSKLATWARRLAV